VDDEGNLLRLKEQDRSRWDRSAVARGMFHLARSAVGTDLSAYHLQAGIAACHTTAASYEQTDWRRILGLYDQWLELDPSPVIALNRSVVVAYVAGPRAGLDAVAAIPNRDKLEGYYLLYAVLGELEFRRHDALTAAGWFRKAASLAELKSEQDFLNRRYDDCVGALDGK
jgi:RNA polymerase sigma-70 factor (ECF subfamily)